MDLLLKKILIYIKLLKEEMFYSFISYILLLIKKLN